MMRSILAALALALSATLAHAHDAGTDAQPGCHHDGRAAGTHCH